MQKLLKQFKQLNVITQLILINIFFYIFMLIIPIQEYFVLPLSLTEFIKQPWSLLTAMFMHNGFMHILFNILYLYIFGKILIHKIHKRDVYKLYIIGGIIVSTLVLLIAILLNIGHIAMGASGAIYAITFAGLFINSNDEISLIGDIQLKHKYIAWFLIFVSIIGLSGTNMLGEVGHLVGAAFGYIWIKQHYGRNVFNDLIKF